MKKSYLIFCFFILNLLIGQNYLWPTNSSKTLTAFFAEERPRRYHAVIDIRTYGKTGFEVYAIEDGYIEKIKINYKGYGNTIYLKLNDGNTAVYAHLDKFYPELDEIINIIKKDYNNQVIEHYFNNQELIVKKGAIIGYTGDTGTISGPHLHFEIRDKNNVSINPLINFYKIEDTLYPIPQKIAIIPKNKNTKIDGSSDIMFYDLVKSNENEYYISDTISIIDEFGIALNIIDKINKQPFDYGLHKIQLYIDGKMKYKIEYNEYDFLNGELVEKERNYFLKRTENKRYYNLYNSTPELSFIDQRSWPSYKLKEGLHNIVIKASDVNNNEIIIFGTILSKLNEKLIYELEEKENLIYFSIDEQDNSYEYIIDICNKYDGETIKSISTKEKEISIKNSMLNETFTVMKLYGKKINGLKTKKEYYEKAKEIKSINGNFKIKSFEHGILIQFIEETFSNESAKINLILKDSILSYETNRIEQNILSTNAINYSNLHDLKALEIEYNTKPKIKIKDKINADLFILNNGIYLSENKFSFGTNENFIQDTALIWISNKNNKNIPENSTLILGPYDTNPKTLIFKEEVNIDFEYENDEIGIGIYYYDNKREKWIYLETKYENGIYSAPILSNEMFVLLKENNPPVIKSLIPDIDAIYKSNDINSMTFFIEDELSGIAGIDNIIVKINEVPVLFEYNTYKKQVLYNFEEWLTPGVHTLDIKIKDNVGNITRKKGEFIIQ